MVPGETLPEVALAVAVEGGVESVRGHGVVPEVFAEVLAPGVEAGAVAPGGLDHGGEAAVAAAEDAFEDRFAGVVPAEIEPGLAAAAAEEALDLASLVEATCFYRGNARDAARHYPKNSNVAATVALAGMGFEDTEVELVADPMANDTRHEIEVRARSGSFRIELSGLPLADSPKTSALAAYSVAKCLRDLDAVVKI